MNRKIIYVTSQFPFGNREIWAFRELDSLIETGIDVIIIPRTGYGKINHQNANKLLNKTIGTPFLNFKIFISLIKKIIFEINDFLKILKWIIDQSNSYTDFLKALIVFPKSLYIGNLLKNQGIEHVHAFSTTSVAVVAFIIAHELKIPWSLTVHTSCDINESHRRSYVTQLKSVKFVRAISNQVSKRLIEFVGSELSKKVNIVHLGVYCDKKIPIFLKDKNDFVIVSPGGPWPYKGIDISIHAAKILLEKGVTNFKWIVYGDGPQMKEVLKMRSDLGLDEHFIFAGFIDNQTLLNSYKEGGVDVVVLNSILRLGQQEGIPVSLMEAMSTAVPVIATDCGGTKELVDGNSGVLINPGDPDATAMAIIDLINNKEKCIMQGQKGREKIINEFDSLKNAKQLTNFFFEEYSN